MRALAGLCTPPQTPRPRATGEAWFPDLGQTPTRHRRQDPASQASQTREENCQLLGTGTRLCSVPQELKLPALISGLPMPEPGCSVPGSEREGTGEPMRVPGSSLPPPTSHLAQPGQGHLLLILGVVSVTARILVLLPVFAMLAGGEEQDVLPVVDVI